MSLALSARHAPEIEWIGQLKGGEAACYVVVYLFVTT